MVSDADGVALTSAAIALPHHNVNQSIRARSRSMMMANSNRRKGKITNGCGQSRRAHPHREVHEQCVNVNAVLALPRPQVLSGPRQQRHRGGTLCALDWRSPVSGHQCITGDSTACRGY